MRLPIHDTPSPLHGDRAVLRYSENAVLLERKEVDFVVADAEGGERRYFLYPTKRVTKKEALALATAEFERRVSGTN